MVLILKPCSVASRCLDGRRDVLTQEPHQRHRAAAARERGLAETTEEVVVRQGAVRRRVR